MNVSNDVEIGGRKVSAENVDDGRLMRGLLAIEESFDQLDDPAGLCCAVFLIDVLLGREQPEAGCPATMISGMKCEAIDLCVKYNIALHAIPNSGAVRELK